MPLNLSHIHKKWNLLRKRSFKKGKDQLSTEHIYIPNSTLPLELYRPIIEQVKSKSDLYNLLFVSRFVRLEAERVLYHTVISSYYSRLPLFLEQIPLCDRVAFHVRDLSIDGIHLHGSIRNSLEQALQHMCNLRNLMLESSLPSAISFSGCRFQLHALVMWNMSTRDSAFLETQQELTILDIGGRFCNISFSSDAFPKLQVLSASFPESIYLINSRPLRALRLQEYPQTGSHIRQQSVRSLRLPFAGPPEDFSAIVKAFPSLRYLRIDLETPWPLSTNWETPWSLSTDFVQLFTLLTHLDSLQKLDIYMDRHSSGHAVMLAENSFAILKTLQVFAFESYREKTYHMLSWRASFRMEWVRGVKGYKEYLGNNGEWKDSCWC